MLTTDATICRAAFDLVMVIGPAPTYVKKTLRKKGSGEEVGMAFVRIEEAKFGLEDLVWAEDDEYAQQEGVFDKGSFQKRFSGIRPLRGGGTPLFR